MFIFCIAKKRTKTVGADKGSPTDSSVGWAALFKPNKINIGFRELL